MGSLSAQKLSEIREHNAEVARSVARTRIAIADKVVMAVIDKLIADIVRPGPTPEERECYEMAQEIRDMVPELTELVEKIIKVAAEES